MRPVRDALELARAFEEPWALVFKHSTRCPVNTAAHREVAERTGVRHESPQAIVLTGGSVAWSDSHEGVTADALEVLLPEPVAP